MPLEVSLDGVNFVQIAAEGVASNGVSALQGTLAARYVRAGLSFNPATTSLTADAWVASA